MTTTSTSTTTTAQAGPTTAPARPRRRRHRVEPVYWLYLLPTLGLFTVFVVVPAVQGLFYSLTSYAGFGEWSFVGLSNYTSIVSDPAVLESYGFTLGFAAVSVVIAQALALVLALGLVSRIRYRTALRTVFVLPMVISGIVIAYVFSFLFSNSLPELGSALGIEVLSSSLLADEQLAWTTIVVVSVWQTVPGAMLVYIAGLLAVPGDVYEASALDGASAWRTLRHITLPLIAGFVLINTVLGVKGYLNAYDVIVGLTAGGPGTATRSVAMTIFSGFTGGDFAYQMANASIFFVLTVVIAVLQLLATRGRNVF